LWVNQDLAKKGSDDIASVLMLKRVEPCESGKTAEGRRVRKELAIHTVEEDLGVNAKTLQMEQIRSLATRAGEDCVVDTSLFPSVPMEIQCTHSTCAHSVSSASHDDQADLTSELADSSSSESPPPSDKPVQLSPFQVETWYVHASFLLFVGYSFVMPLRCQLHLGYIAVPSSRSFLLLLLFFTFNQGGPTKPSRWYCFVVVCSFSCFNILYGFGEQTILSYHMPSVKLIFYKE
jgi:hypothetical protein